MAALTNRTPANTYTGLLQMSNSTTFGLNTTLTTVKDGAGTAASALQLSTTKINFDRSGGNEWQLDGVAVTATAAQLNAAGASNDATFVVLSADGDLPNERVLTGTSAEITFTDNGAGSTVVASLPTALTFTGKTITGGTFSGGTFTTPTITVTDGGLSITGSSDATKIAKFEVDGFTTATTRTFTLPDVSDTLVTLSATQALTNKTLSGTTLTMTGIITLGSTTTATTIKGADAPADVDMNITTGTFGGGRGFLVESGVLGTSGLTTGLIVDYLSSGRYSTLTGVPHNFYTNGVAVAQQFAVEHTASAVNYWAAQGGATTGNARLFVRGSDTNIYGVFISKGSGGLRLATNADENNYQVQISAVASAVNYIDLSGNVTSGGPRIKFTGSDTNVVGAFQTKGSGSFVFSTDGGDTPRQFEIYHTASATNNIRITGSNGGSSLITTSGGNLDIYSSTGTVSFGANISANYVSILGGGGGNPQLTTNGANLLLMTGSALATGATAGMILINACSGTPTGAPTGAGAGAIPMMYDTSANKIWFYNGSWRGVLVA